MLMLGTLLLISDAYRLFLGGVWMIDSQFHLVLVVLLVLLILVVLPGLIDTMQSPAKGHWRAWNKQPLGP